MNEVVKYNNNMNEVSFRSFTSRELDVFYSICSKMRDKNVEVIEFSFEDIERLSKINAKNTDELVSIISSMYDKLIQLNFKIGDNRHFVKFVLFKKYEVNCYDRTVKIAVNEDFKDILNNITSNFTRFELQEFVSLKSSYSKECYRHLKQFKNTGIWKVSIDEFRRLMDIPDSYRMCHIDTKILKFILDELSTCFKNLKVKKIKKKGRGRGGKVVALEFTFTIETVKAVTVPKVKRTAGTAGKTKKTKNKRLTKFHNFDEADYDVEQKIKQKQEKQRNEEKKRLESMTEKEREEEKRRNEEFMRKILEKKK